jgi:flagellar hook protein FlgE
MSLSVSLSGIQAAQAREDIRAHNVANLNTPRFHAQQANTAAAPDGGVYIESVTTSTAPGTLMLPENASDPAEGIQGSNVDLTREQTGRVLDIATFKANAAAVHAQDDMLGATLDILA